MMKKLALILLCGLVAGAFAQETKTNLLTGPWRLSKAAKVTLDADTQVITCVNPDKNRDCYAVMPVKLNQTEPKAITFSAETKSTALKGGRGGFCVYLDLTMQDGSHVWGRQVLCKPGTTEWEKAEGVYKPTKPIKSLSFYVMLRSAIGTAQFRNMTLTQEK